MRGDRRKARRFVRPAGSRRLPHVRALDGLRGLAALSIVMHHTLYTSAAGYPWHGFTRLMTQVPRYFLFGVDLFFVLSGYLITSLLLTARRSPNFYHNFYWKRVFRILPPLILVLLVTHWMHWLSWNEVLLALFFVANLRELWHLPEGGPFWSLSIEEQFYIVWPAVVRREQPRTMFRTLIVLMVVPAVLRILSVGLNHGRMRYTFVHCDGLAWGALLALLAYRARIPYRRLNDLKLWRSTGRWMLWVGAVSMTASIAVAQTGHREYGMLLTSAAPLFSGVIVYLLTHRDSPIARFLSTAPLRFLGNISYMLYLVHAYVMGFYDEHFSRWTAHPTPSALYLRFGSILVVSVLISTASLFWFERPVGALRRFVLRRE